MDCLENNKKIVLYGLGTETERLISQMGGGLNLIGLLDGYRESGELYGYPIISLTDAITCGVEKIIVVARPGSCKVIAKRIGETCKEHGIEVVDVRGNNLLVEKDAKFNYSGIVTYTKSQLKQKIEDADVISFDLFDTLIARKVFSYTDVFFGECAETRLAAEKELSRETAPTLKEIYERVVELQPSLKLSIEQLADGEWKADCKTTVLRDGMKDILEYARQMGKEIILTTDCYYSKSQVEGLLQKFELDYFDEVFVSCEYKTSKTQRLFEKVKEYAKGKSILHIGDDQWADCDKAEEFGIESFKIYSGKELFDLLGGMGVETYAESLADYTKLGLFIASRFNNPFQFENDNNKPLIADATKVGYEVCGPVIVDFMEWLIEKSQTLNLAGILLCARDGYLLETIYNQMVDDKKAKYFLTSRISAIRAGVQSEEDIEYVDSMKFFGDTKESMHVRFGIDATEIPETDRNEEILRQAKIKRENYKKYIDSLHLSNETLGVFDFVAKGTTQLFLQNIMTQKLKGLYFLQLEPEFMSDKNLDIESFYMEEERDSSVIFENYYILETVLTSPSPSVDEFDEAGQPIYAKETRSEESLRCVEKMQKGILDYAKDYLSLVDVPDRKINKKLDEAFLSLIGKIQITDQSFNSLVIEDPFFGRMTNIKDVL